MRFNEFADIYPQRAFIQKQLAQWLSSWLIDDASQQKNVLELGAGTGFLTKYLVSHFNTVHALDESSRMISNGIRYCPQAQWSQANAWQIDLNIDIDLLTSSSLLQWAPNPQSIIQHWANCLSPGGRMLHGFFIAPSLEEIRSIDSNLFPLTWHDAEQWTQYFKNAGLSIIRAEEKAFTYNFPRARALFSYFKETGATDKNRVSPSCLLHVIREYNKRFSYKDGIKSSWTFFRIEAEKE